MNKNVIFAVFLLICGTLYAYDDQDVIVTQEMPSEQRIEEFSKIDTSTIVTIKSCDTIIDGHHVISDSILVEKIIEKTEPLLILYKNKEWSKLVIGIMSLFFVVASILWNRHKKKMNKNQP